MNIQKYENIERFIKARALYLCMFIETIIGSPAKVKVLRVLLESKIAYSLADIKKLSGLSIGVVHKTITLLLKENLILEKKGKGKQRYYQINLDNKYSNSLSVIFDYERNERRGIPLHIWNILESLCSNLKSEFKKVEDILLYGSLARGEFRISSDIDLLIITQDDFSDETGVRKMCSGKKIKEKIKNKINPTFVTQKEIGLARSKGSDYYENIFKESLRLA